MEDSSIEKIIEIAGNKHKYQYIVALLAFGVWVTLDIISISLPYLEKMPLVTYKVNNHSNITTVLTYNICESRNFTIVQSSKHSWVVEYGIYCDRVKTGLIGTTSFFGVFVGSILFQYLSDNVGRRKTVVVLGYMFSLLLLGSLFIRNIYDIYVGSVFITICAICGGLGSFLLVNEITAIDLRSKFGAFVNSAFSFSGIIFISLLYYTDSWRICFIIGSLLNLFIIMLFQFFVFESPRFYLNLNKIDLFIENLKDTSLFNKTYDKFDKLVLSNYQNDQVITTETEVTQSKKEKNINDEETVGFIENSPENVEEKEIKTIVNSLKELKVKNMISESKHGFFSLLKFRSQRYNFLIMCYIWFATSGSYYGLSINIKNLPGNMYINGIIIYIFEVIAYILSGWLINIKLLGRKNTMLIFYSISLTVYLLLNFFKANNYDHLETTFAFIARLCVSAIYNIIYTYSTEIYPTPVRSKGFGTNSVSARVGGMIFPLLIELLSENVNYLFIFVNIISIILIFFLPETLGMPLQNTIPEEKKE